MHHELREFESDAALARAAAQVVTQRAVAVVSATGTFTLAVSGGHTPWAMFAELVTGPMPWEQTIIFQVDERVAPDGDNDRNLTNLIRSLAGVRPDVRPMPVTLSDLDAGARDYA